LRLISRGMLCSVNLELSNISYYIWRHASSDYHQIQIYFFNSIFNQAFKAVSKILASDERLCLIYERMVLFYLLP